MKVYHVLVERRGIRGGCHVYRGKEKGEGRKGLMKKIVKIVVVVIVRQAKNK